MPIRGCSWPLKGGEIWNGFVMRFFKMENDWELISVPQNDQEDAKLYFNHLCGELGLKQGFYTKIDFTECIFKDAMDFSGFIFPAKAFFRHAIFEQEVTFYAAEFNSGADFTHAEFYNRAQFHRSTFQESASFKATKFHSKQMFVTEGKSESQIRPAFISPSFVGTKFQSTVDFRSAEFKTPPHFEGAECDAIFFDKNTEFKNDFDQGRLHLSASAWAALIRLMERVHNLPMRQKFHEKLLEVDAKFKTERYAKLLYFLHSWMGAGQSAFLPFYAWTAFNVLFFAYYSYFLPVASKALPFTLMNAIPFITTFNRQIVKEFITDKEDVISYIMFGAGVHTFLSGIFIFFIGLALRNRFRMKS